MKRIRIISAALLFAGASSIIAYSSTTLATDYDLWRIYPGSDCKAMYTTTNTHYDQIEGNYGYIKNNDATYDMYYVCTINVSYDGIDFPSGYDANVKFYGGYIDNIDVYVYDGKTGEDIDANVHCPTSYGSDYYGTQDASSDGNDILHPGIPNTPGACTSTHSFVITGQLPDYETEYSKIWSYLVDADYTI